MIRRTEYLRRQCNRSAFTLVETCIGIVVISMVLSAAAAFALSTADAWEAGATTDPVSGQQITAAVHVIATLAAARLENELSGADSPGGYYAGSLTDTTVQQAELMLWTDTNNDHAIQANELELIQYDPTNHMLVKYLPTGSTVAPTGPTQLSDPTWIATYRASATSVPLARYVDGVQFYVQNPASTIQKPLVEYQLRFVRNDQVTMRYGAVCMRAPSTPAGP